MNNQPTNHFCKKKKRKKSGLHRCMVWTMLRVENKISDNINNVQIDQNLNQHMFRDQVMEII